MQTEDFSTRFLIKEVVDRDSLQFKYIQMLHSRLWEIIKHFYPQADGNILEYLDKATENLAKDAFENLEIDGGFSGTDSFLRNQFDIRLENLLVAKKSSIHHLESGMKNVVIQRKQIIFDRISKRYKN